MDALKQEFRTMTIEDMQKEFSFYAKITRGNQDMFNELVDLFWHNVALYTI